MAYNKIYLDQKIAEIQKLTIEYTAKGCTYAWIYRNIISPRFHVSKRTFENYLSLPVKKDKNSHSVD